MLPYSTCKALKEKGFPHPEVTQVTHRKTSAYPYVYYPTLEDLLKELEKTGLRISTTFPYEYGLERQWFAQVQEIVPMDSSSTQRQLVRYYVADTLEEALANVYLAL